MVNNYGDRFRPLSRVVPLTNGLKWVINGDYKPLTNCDDPPSKYHFCSTGVFPPPPLGFFVKRKQLRSWMKKPIWTCLTGIFQMSSSQLTLVI